MKKILRAVLLYRLVAMTALVGALGAILWAFSHLVAIQILFSGFALAVAAMLAWQMIRQLRHGHFGVDVLAVIAIVATVVVGEYVASMVIVLMVSGGRALEDFAESRAQRELSALLAREPQVAHRVDQSSQIATDVELGEVLPGDIILVKSGEVVPVDGVLLAADASFDESSLTGESMPVRKFAGESVLSGSLNGLNTVTITASATAADSQFQGIIALVRQAQENRAPVVRLADRYAVPFTIVSLALGVGAWIVAGDPHRFAEVLVLATPCPLLLAAPIAFMGGMSRAARNGVIVKGGSVLESLARIQTAVFDKTGTLTHGTPTIARIRPLAPFDEDALLTLVASAEQFSSHVLATSIVAEARNRRLVLLDVDSSSEDAAQGITARIRERQVSLGTLAFCRELVPDIPRAPTAGGELAIYVVIDGRYAGSIIASDPIRDNAYETVAALRSRGVREVLMLTGDAHATADHVAHAVGITSVRSDCLPADKLRAVQQLTARPVLMVGDGVNDAPVLAAAEVGIAMGAKGATAASESAAAVILVDDLSRTVRALDIGADTVRIAVQSMWLGIGLSLVLMVIAAFGVIPATLGALIQEFVDLVTIANALRAIGTRRGDAAPKRIRSGTFGSTKMSLRESA
ncbi:heavy metal translocating P-type ATPase [Parafrigoribacterium soli]|uniref:heavy metal translocating P-type ATPase n=1 Tax=Parafrigoribacterium soli TaxID=3144663 RepID=UPI0032F0446A